MQRQKKQSYSGGRYPDLGAYLRRHGRRVGMTLVVGVAATGCIWPWHVDGDIAILDTADTGDTAYDILGDIAETGEVYRMVLPEEGSQHLVFASPWGEIDYHLDVVVDDWSLFDWIMANPDRALAAVDDALGAHPVGTFDHYEDSAAIEAEIIQALADAVAGSAGGDTSSFVHVTLSIDSYTDEQDIDGGIG